MVSASTAFKVCSAFTVAYASECADGSCQSESATMLQTKKRSGVMSHDGRTVQDLHKSTMKLLKEGGTPEVVAWAEKAITEITDDVETAIKSTHDEEQKLVSDTVARFGEIASQFAAKVVTLNDLRESHRDKSSSHLACRGQEGLDCNAHTACVVEEESLKQIMDQAHGHFQTAVDSVKQCDGNSIQPMHEQEQKHKVYVEDGQKYFDAWEAYEKKHNECNGLYQVLSDQRATCDGLKQEFEAAACTSHDHYTMSYADMVQDWELQERQYASVRSTVEAGESDRKAEFETLAEVKCLLAKVQERGGKPCDEDEEEGLSEKIEEQCQEQAKNSSHLNVNYPEPPVQPARPAEEEYPCTPKFIEDEYSGLRGHCFDNLPLCKACDGSSVSHHARKSFHNVCIKSTGDSFASIPLDEDVCVSSIHFTHTSGKVSCRSAASGDSNWGCDANSIGLVITDESRVTAPVFGATNGFTPSYSSHAHWYTLSGVSHDSETMDWVFKEPFRFAAKEYKLWYNEDLTGGTEGDNRGEACYDVVVHESESACAALAPLQFANVCVSAKGDAHGTIDLPQDTCVTGIDVYFISGSVSCAGSGGRSNFGCGTDLVGLVWTEDGKTEVVMPRQDQVDGMTQTTHSHAHWYTMSGVGKDTRTLPMRLKSGVAPLKVSGKFDLWYNEDLTGGTESDNDGTACYEVAVHRALSC
jgi:hypothetical protein